MKQSNPAEITSGWAPAGDDSQGWLYTLQTYDWKGRPLLTTNAETTQKLVSYGGCGCAGGEVVTVQDEVGRQQRRSSDVLGRAFKTEVLKADGSVYSAAVTEYNVRDQVKAVKTYKGAATSDFSCPSGTCLQSVTTYDGYGRVATQKLPQQTTAATYAYNLDDTVQSVTDPRGVVATNTYNNRHLLSGVSYSAPAGIYAPAPVSFTYDAVGNRTSMSDGTGSISHGYDQLSRMTSETRTFAGLGNNQYTISYGYNLSGALTSVTDPAGAQVSYNYDATGRLMSMPATGYSGVTNFLSNTQYRAFGGMKHATYGNSVQVDLSYNARMQIGQYQASGLHAANGSPYSVGATMSYYADGRTNTANDLSDAKFDRKYEFDFSARLKEAYSGVEAHGQPAPPLEQANSPYRQSYTYNEFNDVLMRSGRTWTNYDSESASYTNDNKRQGWSYDNAGNALTTFDGAYTYDAASRPVSFTSSQTWKAYPDWPSNPPDGPALETHDTFDGTGQIVKHINTTRSDDSWVDEYGIVHYWPGETTAVSYYVHSTLLGGKTIAEVRSNGNIGDRFVYAGGARVATYHWMAGSTDIESTNPVTGAAITVDVNGNNATRQEPDPLGRDVAQAPPPTPFDPFGSANLKDRVMPIEYTGGPSDYYEQGNAWWAGAMAVQTWLYQTDYFKHKNEFINAVINQQFDKAAQILAKNPNFVIEINGQMTAGQSAADAFTTALAKLPGDPLGMQNQTASINIVGGTMGAPQTPVPERHMLDDCHAFAAIVDEIARGAHTDDGFVRGLQWRLQARAGTPEYDEFRAGGFKEMFHDDNGSYNQVRHFVGTFAGGFFGALALRAATLVQGDPTPLFPVAMARAAVAAANRGEDSAPDRALNEHSVRTGVYLGLGRTNRNQIGSYIRSNVCESKK